jgi:hypothetical protein
MTLRHAIEVQHESCRDPAFLDMVRERNMAIVEPDGDQFPCIDAVSGTGRARET